MYFFLRHIISNLAAKTLKFSHRDFRGSGPLPSPGRPPHADSSHTASGENLQDKSPLKTSVNRETKLIMEDSGAGLWRREAASAAAKLCREEHISVFL